MQALEMTTEMGQHQQYRISLRFDPNSDVRRYNLPAPNVREIAVVVVGDGEQITGPQDIIVYRKGRLNNLFRISDSHPLYPSLRYVLLFPTGQMGWHPHIPYIVLKNQTGPYKRPNVTLEEYFRYRFHVRPSQFDSNHLFLAGRLFQAYVCESWAVAEQHRLAQLANIQDNLRVDLYQGLADAIVANVDVNINDLGRRTILPSSFTGGTCYMQQLCQDALAINRYFGGGDLFITMTATLHGQRSQMPFFMIKSLMSALISSYVSFMPSFTPSLRTLTMVCLVTLLAIFTPLSFRRGAFLMLTLLFF